MIKIIFTISALLLLNTAIYSQKSNTLKDKMDNYTQKVKMKWEFNPLKNYETDRYFSGWLDPNAYSSRFWLGDIFNIEQMYNNDNFNFDKMDFYYQPTLATELAPIAFRYNEVHRFKIGVGYLTHFFLSKYKKGYDQYYGQSLMYGTYMQVEVFFDYIFNNTFKLRFSPLRHICAHISGDILIQKVICHKCILGSTGRLVSQPIVISHTIQPLITVEYTGFILPSDSDPSRISMLLINPETGINRAHGLRIQFLISEKVVHLLMDTPQQRPAGTALAYLQSRLKRPQGTGSIAQGAIHPT